MEVTPDHQEGNEVDDEKPSTSKNLESKSGVDVQKEGGGGDESSYEDDDDDDQFSYASSTQFIEDEDSPEPDLTNVVTQRGFRRGPAAKMRAVQRGQRRSIKGRYKYGKVSKKYRRTAAATTRSAPKRRKIPMTRIQKESVYSMLSTRDCPCSEGTCPTCGHRCCLKRCPGKRIRMDEIGFCLRCRRDLLKMASKSCKKRRRQLRLPCWVAEDKRKEEAVQVGSRFFEESASLFVKKAKVANAKSVGTMPIEEGDDHCEITPHMIKETMNELTRWRQAVEANAIMNFLKNNYPVNQNELELFNELDRKLEVAVEIGLLECDAKGRYMLKAKLERFRQLSRNHVNLFWKKYRDNLKPVAKKFTSIGDVADDSRIHLHDYNNMYL